MNTPIIERPCVCSCCGPVLARETELIFNPDDTQHRYARIHTGCGALARFSFPEAPAVDPNFVTKPKRKAAPLTGTSRFAGVDSCGRDFEVAMVESESWPSKFVPVPGEPDYLSTTGKALRFIKDGEETPWVAVSQLMAIKCGEIIRWGVPKWLASKLGFVGEPF